MDFSSRDSWYDSRPMRDNKLLLLNEFYVKYIKRKTLQKLTNQATILKFFWVFDRQSFVTFSQFSSLQIDFLYIFSTIFPKIFQHFSDKTTQRNWMENLLLELWTKGKNGFREKHVSLLAGASGFSFLKIINP